jgi:hypothetical protein
VEAAVLALVIAEDWPWRAWELAERLGVPVDVIGVCVGRLCADGLLVAHSDTFRASLTAIRGDELARCWSSLVDGSGAPGC